MPFVRKTDSQGSQHPTDTRKLFIGRTGELLFFVQNILKPEEPTHNIISIWGQGGVGKSTLLARFIDEAHAADFKDYCLTALVDERQTTPTSIMEKFADELHITGDFEKALRRYKEALRKLQTERETMQDPVLNRVPDFAGAAAEMVPVVGPLLREGAKATAGLYLDKRQKVQGYRDAEILEDPIHELTKAFVNELNQLAESQVLLSSKRVKNLRVVLFFDTFEQLATEAAPWLLNYFLPADIKGNIVLVIAGRDSIEHSIPEDTKHWLPYCDNETIYWIPLNSFTEDETRAYLTKRNIIDPERIATIWQLSQGLPLYLSLLTSNPQGKVDPMKDVVNNFLRWIPGHEHVKRQLALDAALFSRPFNQDDLEAFSYLSEHERPILYRWLVELPFVLPKDGRYRYHDLARELFSHHLYQLSRNKYDGTRRALAHYYQQMIETVQTERGMEVYRSDEWMELSLALASQLFLLSDEASYIKGIEQVLRIYKQTSRQQDEEITRVLHQLLRTQSAQQISLGAVRYIQLILQFIGTKSDKKEILFATGSLLEELIHNPSFPTELLACIYLRRGWVYYGLREYQQALDDINHALELDPKYVDAYLGRGWVYYYGLREYQQALDDFNRVLELDPKHVNAYYGRGWVYFGLYYDLKEYQQALDDFNRVLELDPNYAPAYYGRGRVYHDFLQEYQRATIEFDRAIEVDPNFPDSYLYRGGVYYNLKEYQRAIADFDRAIEAYPDHYWSYSSRGQVYYDLKEYQRAIADFDRALEINPNQNWVYSKRGFTYLWMKDIIKAKADFTLSWRLNSKSNDDEWMIEWCIMCQTKPDLENAERLEAIARTSSNLYSVHLCQAIALWLRESFKKALAELEQAKQFELERPGAYYWKGIVYASLGQDEEAIAAIERSLELELPPILLTPLRWFEQDRPDFYQKYVVPLMTRYDLL